jgi:hypothetical protein
MKKNKDYSLVFLISACFLMTAFEIWLISRILPLIGFKDKILNDFVIQMENFENLGGWFLIALFALVLNAILIGIFIKIWRFFLRKRKNSFKICDQETSRE